MKIFYCIPYHNEPEELYSPLLTTLNNQININFDDFVFIMGRGDGETNFPNLSKYKNLNKRFLYMSKYIEPLGPGTSRQLMLDYVKEVSKDDSDCLVFADIDDDLVSNTSLSFLLENIEMFPQAQAISFSYKASDYKLNQFYINDVTYPWEVWSTAYRVSHLKEFNINFPTTFISTEDVFFSCCVQAVTLNHPFIGFSNYYHHIVQKESKSITVDYHSRPMDWMIDQRVFKFTREYMKWVETLPYHNDTCFFNWLFSNCIDYINQAIINYPDEFKDELKYLCDACDRLIDPHISFAEGLKSKKGIVEEIRALTNS